MGNTVTDVLLTGPDQEEALSRAYAYAVAARAGYVTAIPRTGPGWCGPANSGRWSDAPCA